MVKMSKDVCESCHQKEEDAFARVRDYLRQNAGAGVNDTARETGVSARLIQRFIDSGRLERVGAQVTHTCQTCGAVINNGLICTACSQQLQDQVSRLRQEISGKKEEHKQGNLDRRRDGTGDDGLHVKKIRGG